MAEPTGASTFTKGLAVLACFESRQRGLTMAEIARLTGFDRAATRRLCLSLVEAGYLAKDGQQLSLTPRILAVAGGYLAANDIGLAVQPVLDQFAQTLGEEISLAVRDGDRALYVAQSKTSATRLTFGFTVGSPLPLLHTALGRMALAQCPAAQRAELLARLTPVKHTEKTQLDPATIAAEIAAAEAQGFAHLAEEFEPGVAAIAVPLGRLTGTEAALGCTGSRAKLQDPDHRDAALDTLRQTARALRQLSIFA